MGRSRRSYPSEWNANRSGTCECGKVCFDKKTAQTKRNDLVRRGNARYLKIYPCGARCWHLSRGPVDHDHGGRYRK